jgi:hypothetical protein
VPAWHERHRPLAAGLAAAFLGRDGQASGPLMHFSIESASSAELKAVLLVMRTQVILSAAKL